MSVHFLKLCGPVKSWKRAQDPTNGTPKGFGFCEFESAEGVLRALRLLSKLNIDGQELVVHMDFHLSSLFCRFYDLFLKYIFFDKSVEFISKKRKFKGGATQLYREYN
jgi:RNA recognition motif-containing protein